MDYSIKQAGVNHGRTFNVEPYISVWKEFYPEKTNLDETIEGEYMYYDKDEKFGVINSIKLYDKLITIHDEKCIIEKEIALGLR